MSAVRPWNLLSSVGLEWHVRKVTLITLLLFMGCLGKSAQVPFSRMVAQCDGGSDTGLGADSCRHNGQCGPLSAGTIQRRWSCCRRWP